MIINSIKLENFKCYKIKSVDFAKTQSLIQGAFGTGKSTIYEAFKYALDFKSDFEPIDKNTQKRLGSPEQPITTKVELVIENDNIVHTITRQNTQKYKDGKYEKSNPTYIVDGLKCKTAKEYHEKIGMCFGVNYILLPLLSDIKYFNEELDKNVRYSLLNEFFNIDASLESIKSKFTTLIPYFNKGFTENNINDLINQNISNVNKQLAANKVLLEDRNNKLNNCKLTNFADLHNERNQIVCQINELDMSLDNSEDYKKIKDLYSEKNKIEKNNYSKQVKLFDKQKELSKINNMIQDLEKHFEDLKNKSVILVGKINNANNQKIVDTCSMCGQKLPEELLNKAIENKKQLVKAAIDDMCKTESEMKGCTQKIEQLKKDLETLNVEIQKINDSLNNSNVKSIEKQIKELEKSLDSEAELKRKEEIKNNISTLKIRLQEIDTLLLNENTMDSLIAEIDSIQDKIKALSIQDQRNVLEKDELFKYKVEKTKQMNDIINKAFGSGISFVFFQDLSSNSQKGVKLSCECCLNGINYSNLSTGQKINTNIIVNKVFQNHFGTNLPVWIDDYQCFGEPIVDSRQTILIKTTGKDIHYDNIINIEGGKNE